MKLLEIEDMSAFDHDLYEESLTDWAEEYLKPGEWLYLSFNSILMWEQDYDIANIPDVYELRVQVFKNDGPVHNYKE